MITLPQLKVLLKEHKITNYTYLNKDEIIAVLIDKGIIATSDILQNKSVEMKPEAVKRDSSKYAYLKGIRTNPKTVEVRDLETESITIYRSTYEALRAIDGLNSRYIKNGKVWQDRYEIKVR